MRMLCASWLLALLASSRGMPAVDGSEDCLSAACLFQHPVYGKVLLNDNVSAVVQRLCARDAVACSVDRAEHEQRVEQMFHARGKTGLSFAEAFSAIFGYKRVYETFDEMHIDSNTEAAFRDVGGTTSTDMWWTYKAMSGLALQTVEREQDQRAHTGYAHINFHQSFIYGFMGSYRVMKHQLQEYAALTLRTNDVVGARLLRDAVDAPHLGYSDDAATQYLQQYDGRHIHPNEARHAYYMTVVVDFFGEKHTRNLDFIEIGGGFGNAPRLLASTFKFKSWTILDLQFAINLQQWYLNETIGTHIQIVRNQAGKIRVGADTADNKAKKRGTMPVMNLVSHKHRNRFAAEFERADVLLASHSWSETSMDEFLWYWLLILPRVDYLVYVAQRNWPEVSPGHTSFCLILSTKRCTTRCPHPLLLVALVRTHRRSSL
jgi:hypothetical protein